MRRRLIDACEAVTRNVFKITNEAKAGRNWDFDCEAVSQSMSVVLDREEAHSNSEWPHQKSAIQWKVQTKLTKGQKTLTSKGSSEKDINDGKEMKQNTKSFQRSWNRPLQETEVASSQLVCSPQITQGPHNLWGHVTRVSKSMSLWPQISSG